MAEPQRRRLSAGARKTSEVVYVLDPALITSGRKNKGLSMAELGRRCGGRSRSTIHQVETRQLVKILPSFARDLTRELDLDPAKTFGVADDETPSSAPCGAGT